MSAILRHKAASAKTGAPSRVQVQEGGAGGAALVGGTAVRRRFRFPADPAAELMPAAEFLGQETDFAAILEDFEGSPFDPARRRVLGRLMGMFAMDYQGARSEERRFLRRLLAGRNAREGYAANRALHLCQLPHVIRRTLALAVAESRFAQGSPAGFLGAVQARLAATTFMLLGPRGREAVWNALTLAGTHPQVGPLRQADRLVERALVLKALAARRHLLGPWSSDGRRALDEVLEFARAIRGVSRECLARATTLHEPSPTDGPVSARQAGRLARADIDPIYAFAERGQPRELVPIEGATEAPAEEQLPDLDRGPLIDRPRLHQALAQARTAGDALLAEHLRDALVDYIAGLDLSQPRLERKDAALAELVARGFDVVRPEAVEAIRADARGVYRFDAARALGLLLSPYTGATYVRRVFSDQLTAGADPLRQIVAALEQGLVVPVLLSEPKRSVVRALAALSQRQAQVPILLLQLPRDGALAEMPAPLLLAPVLPPELGKRSRADAYMAPAALDLLAPPFGIPFPTLGIEDRL